MCGPGDGMCGVECGVRVWMDGVVGVVSVVYGRHGREVG